jgi:hypothetical protein
LHIGEENRGKSSLWVGEVSTPSSAVTLIFVFGSKESCTFGRKTGLKEGRWKVDL